MRLRAEKCVLVEGIFLKLRGIAIFLFGIESELLQHVYYVWIQDMPTFAIHSVLGS